MILTAIKLLKRFSLHILSLGLWLGLTACDSVPLEKMTLDMKKAEMYMLFARFEETYAPLAYKEVVRGFKFEDLKKKYLDKALATSDNAGFYKVVQEFFAEFADAHSSVTFSANSLPGGMQLAYLGFSTTRDGEALIVNGLLPGMSAHSAFPIKVGDRIVGVRENGRVTPIRAYILRELTATKNVGSDEANFTILSGRAFFRDTLSTGLSNEIQSGAQKNVELILSRHSESGEAQLEAVTLPWIVKDLWDLRLEQERLKRGGEEGTYALNVLDSQATQSFKVYFKDHRGNSVILSPKNIFQSLNVSYQSSGTGIKMVDNFKIDLGVTHFLFSEGEDVEHEEKETAFEKLQKERFVPHNIVPVPGAKTFAAYIEMVPMMRGKKTAYEPRGYLRLHTFAPDGDEDAIVDELKETLRFLGDYGVTNLVVDSLDNGGGSLSLGLKIAQLFSPSKKLNNLKIQFGLSENWLTNFKGESLMGPSETEKEIKKQLLVELRKDKNMGKKISRTFPIENILPYQIENDPSLPTFNVAVLVNEMCASMGDLFAALMKENDVATLIGTRTMGAGGNVVSYTQSPFSHFQYRQTESLFLTPNGKYIENNGVTPDIYLNTPAMALDRFEDVIQTGFLYLSRPTAFKKQIAATLAYYAHAEDKIPAEKPDGFNHCEKGPSKDVHSKPAPLPHHPGAPHSAAPAKKPTVLPPAV